MFLFHCFTVPSIALSTREALSKYVFIQVWVTDLRFWRKILGLWSEEGEVSKTDTVPTHEAFRSEGEWWIRVTIQDIEIRVVKGTQVITPQQASHSGGTDGWRGFPRAGRVSQAENKVAMGKAVCGERPVGGSTEELQSMRQDAEPGL